MHGIGPVCQASKGESTHDTYMQKTRKIAQQQTRHNFLRKRTASSASGRGPRQEFALREGHVLSSFSLSERLARALLPSTRTSPRQQICWRPNCYMEALFGLHAPHVSNKDVGGMPAIDPKTLLIGQRPCLTATHLTSATKMLGVPITVPGTFLTEQALYGLHQPMRSDGPCNTRRRHCAPHKERAFGILKHESRTKLVRNG